MVIILENFKFILINFINRGLILEIQICKYCNGTGKTFDKLKIDYVPCPVCNGIGEYEIDIDYSKAIQCKYCNGTGKTFDKLKIDYVPCPICKGIRFIERNKISIGKKSNELITSNVPRPTKYEYDIAVSFAGEDREKVKPYVDILMDNKIKIFYDDDKKWEAWGKDMYVYLDEIYRLKAKYCVMFISEHYAKKLWTNHERESAQARAFRENKEYILPVKIDDTQIPGIRETTGYIDLRNTSVKELAELTIKKLNQ